MDYEKLMKQAHKTNERRDKAERVAGFAAPIDVGLLGHIRTVTAAIEAGIKTDDWNCIAEAQAMLEQAIEVLDGIPFNM